MKHCALCGWSGDDSYTVCPNAAAHPVPSLAARQDARDQQRVQAVAGGVRADGLRGPVRHYLSEWMDVYQDADGRFVNADGQPVRSGRKRLR